MRILTDAGAYIASVSAKLPDIAIGRSESSRTDVLEALERRGCCLIQEPAQYVEALMTASRVGQA